VEDSSVKGEKQQKRLREGRGREMPYNVCLESLSVPVKTLGAAKKEWGVIIFVAERNYYEYDFEPLWLGTVLSRFSWMFVIDGWSR
jgi:hypothetical protein